MSTRSAIARPHGDGWIGVYHHSDGYPSGLGVTLWEAYHATFGQDVKAMRELLIDSEAASTGWSCIIGYDLTEAPNWRTGPGPQSYHARGEDPSDFMICTCPNVGSFCGPLDIEWAYVLADHALVVFKNVQGGPEGYQHKMVGEYPWQGPIPDWDTMEKAEP